MMTAQTCLQHSRNLAKYGHWQEARNASASRDNRTRYHSEPRTVATTSDPDPSIALTAPPRKYRLPRVRVRSETSRASASASPMVGGVHCKGLFRLELEVERRRQPSG